MFTDMVGSTELAQANEAAALRLADEQQELIRRLVAEHHGREIKSLGDGFLIEFESALHAVECAIAIQQLVRERTDPARGPPLRLRIGIHLGDVEIRGADIVGDSVNVASRIEPLAEPGGICVTEPVYGQVHNKLDYRLEKIAPAALKGVTFPVGVYRVVLPRGKEASNPTVVEIPGLAVLPFSNISPDPNDAYFADGLTEELITVLSQVAGLRVIARTSVVPYRSTSKGVAQIGFELRVSFLLEGSVRKAGSRLRVTAQLIDVGSEGHLWAKSYDRELDDIFAVQTELAHEVAEALKIELRAGESARIERRPSVRTDSYLAYLKGRIRLQQESALASAADAATALREFDRAIALDPTNAAAHAGRSDAIRTMGWVKGKAAGSAASAAQSRTSAQRAIELDPNLAEGHAALGIVLWDEGDFGGAEVELKRSVALNPSLSWAHVMLGCVLEDEGKLAEAFPHFELAEAADPLSHRALAFLGRSLFWQGRLDEVLAPLEKAARLAPADPWSYAFLAEYYLARSDRDRALHELARAEEIEPVTERKAGWRAWYYQVAGENEKSRRIVREEELRPDRVWPLWYLAELYVRLGDLDDGYRLLDQAVVNFQLPFQAIRYHPLMRPVRDDARYPGLLKKARLA
jgi:adenylate cyclase